MLLDHTSLECLQRCDAEWTYRHLRHLDRAGTSAAILAGLTVHKGVQEWYRTDDADAAVAVTLAYWREHEATLPPPGKKPEWRTAALCASVVRLYAARYPVATRGYSVVWNEDYLVAGEDHGIPDRVIRRDADGQLYVLGLKTSALGTGAAYWQQWHNSQEAAIHMDLVEAVTGPVAGFICDHVFLSGRKDGPKGEDLEQSMPYVYSEAKRAELRKQRGYWRDKAKALRIMHQEGIDPLRSTLACIRFNSPCSFLPYCGADPGDREALISRDVAIGTLVEREWNPATRDE